MPKISNLFGIDIYMYADDHNPPHLHAKYGDLEAQYLINTNEVLAGKLPTAQNKLMKQFIDTYREILIEMWNTQTFKKI